MVEICPSIGPFVETARAHLRAHPVPTFTGEVMSEENLQLPLSATIVPVAAAVSALRAQAEVGQHPAARADAHQERWRGTAEQIAAELAPLGPLPPRFLLSAAQAFIQLRDAPRIALLGAQAAGPAILTILIDLVITSSLCIALSRLDGADEHGASKAARSALKGVAANPMPWAILGGALMSWLQLEPIKPVMQTIGLLADAASPVALFTIGAVLARSQIVAARESHGPMPVADYLPVAAAKLLVQSAARAYDRGESRHCAVAAASISASAALQCAKFSDMVGCPGALREWSERLRLPLALRHLLDAAHHGAGAVQRRGG